MYKFRYSLVKISIIRIEMLKWLKQFRNLLSGFDWEIRNLFTIKFGLCIKIILISIQRYVNIKISNLHVIFSKFILQLAIM